MADGGNDKGYKTSVSRVSYSSERIKSNQIKSWDDCSSKVYFSSLS